LIQTLIDLTVCLDAGLRIHAGCQFKLLRSHHEAHKDDYNHFSRRLQKEMIIVRGL